MLIVDYASEFINLLHHRNNRLVWGAMIALSTVASWTGQAIIDHFDDIRRVLENGSVITVDNGVNALALAAAAVGDKRR